MSIGEFCLKRDVASRGNRRSKGPYLALGQLHALHRRFDDDEHPMADQIIAEWALSDDENVRFDALALIEDFKIVGAEPALRGLAGRLGSSGKRGAPYELREVNRVLETIGA